MTQVTNEHRQKACDLLNAEFGSKAWRMPADKNVNTVTTFAKYIAEQEAPKHPPELVEQLDSMRNHLDLARNRLRACCVNLGGTRYSAEASQWAREADEHVGNFDAILAELDALQSDPLVEEAREIVKAFYPNMSADYSGRRLGIAIEALKRGKEGAA